MLEFDLTDIDVVREQQKKFQSANTNNSLFDQEWNIVYKEIEEALITDDFEKLIDTKIEVLRMEIEVAKNYIKQDIQEYFIIKDNFILSKVLDILCCLHFYFQEPKQFELPITAFLNGRTDEDIENDLWEILKDHLKDRKPDQLQALKDSQIFQSCSLESQDQTQQIDLLEAQQIDKLKKKLEEICNRPNE